MNWRSPEKNFKELFFLENTCACVLGPWPWPRAFPRKGCPWPWPRIFFVFLALASSLVSSTPPLVQYLYTYQWYSSGVAKGGGGARPGCHHFGVTPCYEVKPYLH